MDYQLYTDGGCHNNPGPGGWAYVIVADDQEIKRRSRAVEDTTNNRMELQSVIEGLNYLHKKLSGGDDCRITIYTDSRYVLLGATEWIQRWVANGWRSSNRKPVKNKDLWIALQAHTQRRPLRWVWVEGHSGNPTNELCDRLVQKAIAALEAR